VPEIEYVTVADHAEAINGKLYLHGAGWSDLTQSRGPDGQPGVDHFGIAVSIIVGWNETNRRFPLTVTIVHEDGDEFAKLGAQIEAGRPPGVTRGTDFRSFLAVNANLIFPKTGRYDVRAELEGQTRQAAFRVLAQPSFGLMPGQQQAAS
jgi:Family of unknown function (DUF6941)